LVYECDLEWLRPLVEGRMGNTVAKPIKWQKLEDVAVVGMGPQIGKMTVIMKGTNAVYRMLVWIGGVYKGWVEIRKSGVKDGYGLFAVTRFEKGSIITAKTPAEMSWCDSAIPSKDTLHLGWNWVVKKSIDELGPTSNAVYLKENGLIRACTRIMPGMEILLDRENMSSTNGFEWLDSLVFAEPRYGWMSWQTRQSIGRVVSGDKGRGFLVKFDHGMIQNMMENKLKKFALVQNTGAGVREIRTDGQSCEVAKKNEVGGEDERKATDVEEKKRKARITEVTKSKRIRKKGTKGIE